MSQTTSTTTPTAAPTDKVGTYSKLAVSIFAEAIFVAAIVIAYLAKDSTSLTLLMGAVVSMATTVTNFWLGSSQGSSNKDAIIASVSTPSTTTIRSTTNP